MSERVTTWVRRQAVGWGCSHSMTSRVTQGKRWLLSAIDGIFDTGIKSQFNFRGRIGRIYSNTFMFKNCNRTVGVDSVFK